MERTEKFDINLTVISNTPQVRRGRDTSVVRIRDSTGK